MTMAIPSDMDGDPNWSKIQWEIVVRLVPDLAITQAQLSALASRIVARTGITPKSMTLGTDGAVTVVMPDIGVDVAFWSAWVASAVAATGRTGVISAIGNQARITT